MRARMNEFPVLIVEEYLNSDTYGRRPIGSSLTPDETNEVLAIADADTLRARLGARLLGLDEHRSE